MTTVPGTAASTSGAVADLPVSGDAPTAPAAAGILAAVDGSDSSLWALDRAMTEAELFGLTLYVVAVVEASAGCTPGMADLVQESVDRLLASMRDGLRRGVAAVQGARPRPYEGSISLHVVLGDVTRVLLECSAAHHTLVVGTRGNGGFSRLLLGSVSTAAAHHAACPVLIVPAPVAARPGAKRS